MNKKQRKFVNRLLFGFILILSLLTKIGQTVGDAASTNGSNLKMIIGCSAAVVGLIIVNFVVKKTDQKGKA